MIGHVTQERYEQLVAEGRRLVEQQTQAQFALGDIAVEVEPLRSHGGAQAAPDQEAFQVSQSLQMLAEDLVIPFNTIKDYRWIASRWPAQHRRPGVSFSIYRILASITDEQERYARLADPPLHTRSGTRRWTMDAAKRLVGHQVEHPITVQEKVERIHDLARDEEVAARVATDLLRRPQVADRSMRDDLAKHMVNRAQIDHAQQAGQVARQRTPALPRIERSRDFLDLIGTCSLFVASIGRILPGLRDHQFTGDERVAVARNVARVRATADWLEAAIESGDVSLDEGLARLLRGE
ncbi:DUF6192 family protein [Nonomuraea jabiensis]|uniref:DUF6192 family protein n=1 Tax=Nonomuraea jabiensis TaxID=882448 RepID=UPI003D7101D1